MKRKVFTIFFTLLIIVSFAKGGAPDERIAWWQQARFGMFIHWGLYSIPARGEWMFYQEHIPIKEYAKLADEFNPKDFHPEEWVALAKAAGMKYIVITTRHHDGFCLFDSKVSDFTAPKSAAGRDFIAEFVKACRDADMPFGFYYSLVDWRFPGTIPHGTREDDSVYKEMVDQAHSQIRELLTNYGKVDILWYDMLMPYDPVLWRSEELNAMARKLQPDILINDRAGVPGDFTTPENTVSAQAGPWESCYSMNRTWGYARYDLNYKSVNELLRLLASCASQNGNFLLNVAPDGNGRIPIESVERLYSIGKWMKVNGKAIYGAGPSPVVAPNLGLETRVGNKVYLLVQRWPGATVPFAWCGSRVKSATLLSTGDKARIEQKDDRVWLHDLPEYPPDPYLNVIELSFYDEPKASNPPYR
ncbi:alpha-L-fucosidase [hydrothermal vent metagenome]|uniref:alpha-L-fucosidase n=1 Tax=hydrothermal vent metagenome TaxID=652676 RepID=A0A3B1CJU1_9ZZZZ